jgi:hypothetical protein
MNRIIGLAGKSGSGKDVVADHIGEKYGYTKIAVADAIRDEVNAFLQLALGNYGAFMFGKNTSFSDVLEAFRTAVYAKPTTPEMRVILQWWGTEYRRSQNPDYWVDILQNKIMETDLAVVSDVRLPIEIDVIHQAGGEVWFVERPGIAAVGIPNHLTEIGLVGATFDRTIVNDKSLEDLRATIDALF